MQLHGTNSTFETSVVSEAKGFTITASQKAFKVLSSGLYKNKIQAIIRELSTNAVDAHKEAGTDRPFEVHLPCELEPYFHVKDFGVGMTLDKVLTLYNSYFSSTKSDSDEYIGALGLGSKSPFAYSDSFTVESRVDGVKTTYIAAVVDGKPTILTIDSVETDEPNGLEVGFAVKAADFNSFVQEAARVFFFFKDKPLVSGASLSYNKKMGEYEASIEKSFEGEGWTLYNKYPPFLSSNGNYGFTSQAFVLMGGILYPLDAEIFEKDYKEDKEVRFALGNKFIFQVPLGVCDVAPSREDLDYDKLTVQNLVKIFRAVAKEFVAGGKVFESITSSSQTNWDKAVALHKAFSSLRNSTPIGFSQGLFSVVPLTYGDALILAVKLSSSYFYMYNLEREGKLKSYTQGTDLSLTPTTSQVFFNSEGYTQVNSQVKVKMKAYMRENNKKTAIMFSNNLSKEDLEKIGNPTIIKIKDLPNPKKAAATKSNAHADEKYMVLQMFGPNIDIRTLTEGYYTIRKGNNNLFSFSKEGQLERLTKNQGTKWSTDLKEMIRALLPSGSKVVHIPEALYEELKIKKNKKLTLISKDFLVEKVKEKALQFEEAKEPESIIYLIQSSLNVAYSLSQNEDSLLDDSFGRDSLFVKVIKELKKWKKIKSTSSKSYSFSIKECRDTLELIDRSFDWKKTTTKEFKEVEEMVSEFQKRYPLLLAISSLSTPKIDVLVPYVKLMDSSDK